MEYDCYLQTDIDAELIFSELMAATTLSLQKITTVTHFSEWEFNGIGEMNAGEGYQLKVLQSSTLNYQSNNPCATDN